MGAGKHTPGPWKVIAEDLRGGRYFVVYAQGLDEPIAEPHESDNGEANARLIVAAPDLLAASKMASDFIGRLVPTKEGVAAYEALKAAIAKIDAPAPGGAKDA